MITNTQARQLMYDWHDGQWSALYAAASSGIVEDMPALKREIVDSALGTELDLAELDDLAALYAWLMFQGDTRTLPWA